MSIFPSLQVSFRPENGRVNEIKPSTEKKFQENHQFLYNSIIFTVQDGWMFSVIKMYSMLSLGNKRSVLEFD